LRRAGQRRKNDLIIVEGRRELGIAVNAGMAVVSLFYCAEYAGKEDWPKEINDDFIYEVGTEIFDKVSLRDNPDGFLALAKPRHRALEQVELGKNPTVVVLETVEKPGNLGAILRTADAAGADAVILCDPQTDFYNPNVIRASQGTVFSVQTAVCASSEAIGWLKRKKIKIFAAAPRAKKIYTRADFTGPAAIVIGSEHKGLSEAWLSAADEPIKIPMRGAIDSLNASVTAAIILFEATRQK